MKSITGAQITNPIKMKFTVARKSSPIPPSCENEVALLSKEFIDMIADWKIPVDCNEFQIDGQLMTLEKIKNRLGSPNEEIEQRGLYGDEIGRELVYPNYKINWHSSNSWNGASFIKAITFTNLTLPFNNIATNLDQSAILNNISSEIAQDSYYASENASSDSNYYKYYIFSPYVHDMFGIQITLIMNKDNPDTITEIKVMYYNRVG